MFLTQVLLLLVVWLVESSFFLSSLLVLLFTFLSCSPCLMLEQPPLVFLFLWHNLSNLFLCQFKVFRCLASLLVIINFSHSSVFSLSSVSSS